MYYDVLFLILGYLESQKDRSNALQVCTLWYRVINDLTPAFVRNYKAKYSFKITKIRFLIRKQSIFSSLNKTNVPLLLNMFHKIAKKYPILHCHIIKDNYELINLQIQPITSNDEFIVYEANENIKNYKFHNIKWIVSCPEYFFPNQKTVIYKKLYENYQIIGDDLCYQYFKTGLDYRMNNQDITIGSTGNDVCCCFSISLLPE